MEREKAAYIGLVCLKTWIGHNVRHNIGVQAAVSHSTATAQSQHSHSTVPAQPEHSPSTITAQHWGASTNQHPISVWIA